MKLGEWEPIVSAIITGLNSWQIVLLVLGLALIWRLSDIIHAFGKVTNDRKKTHNKHKIDLEKLRNQHNSARRPPPR